MVSWSVARYYFGPPTIVLRGGGGGGGGDRVNITFLILINMKRKQILASEHREGGLQNSY